LRIINGRWILAGSLLIFPLLGNRGSRINERGIAAHPALGFGARIGAVAWVPSIRGPDGFLEAKPRILPLCIPLPDAHARIIEDAKSAKETMIMANLPLGLEHSIASGTPAPLGTHTPGVLKIPY
jgi:hypothetical protein